LRHIIKKIMETKNKKSPKKIKKQEEVTEQKPKSATTLFWEKYPNGIIKILDMKAVLR